MNNAELWQSYKEYTQTLSDNSRKLAFAAGGLCWIFKTGTASFPSVVRVALAFIIVFFICDLLQFIVGAVFLRYWTRKAEKEMWQKHSTIDGDYEKPAWLDTPSFTFWWAKIIALLLAYLFLGKHIFTMN
jgi:hypothetical protein